MLIFFDHPRKNETASLLKPKDFWKSPRLIENLLFSGTSCRAFWPLAPHPLAVLFQTLKRSCAMPCRVHRSASKATRSKMKNRREGFRRLTWLTWNPKMMAWKMIDFLSGAYSQGSILILLGCSPEQYGNTMGNWENYKIVTYIATSYMTQPLRATQPLDFCTDFFSTKKNHKDLFPDINFEVGDKIQLIESLHQGIPLPCWMGVLWNPPWEFRGKLIYLDRILQMRGLGERTDILLMVQKSCTSWGWQFIPLFTRFYASQNHVLLQSCGLETTDSCLPAKM